MKLESNFSASLNEALSVDLRVQKNLLVFLSPKSSRLYDCSFYDNVSSFRKCLNFCYCSFYDNAFCWTLSSTLLQLSFENQNNQLKLSQSWEQNFKIKKLRVTEGKIRIISAKVKKLRPRKFNRLVDILYFFWTEKIGYWNFQIIKRIEDELRSN